jgi:hypothetical protein
MSTAPWEYSTGFLDDNEPSRTLFHLDFRGPPLKVLKHEAANLVFDLLRPALDEAVAQSPIFGHARDYAGQVKDGEARAAALTRAIRRAQLDEEEADASLGKCNHSGVTQAQALGGQQ